MNGVLGHGAWVKGCETVQSSQVVGYWLEIHPNFQNLTLNVGTPLRQLAKLISFDQKSTCTLKTIHSKSAHACSPSLPLLWCGKKQIILAQP